jgi:hypothetical protein
MATTIVTKSGSGAPTASNLVAGELAVDLTNKRLYTENSSGTVLELGTNPASDVTFGDNTKAVFGDGSDLRIYHTGSHSTIENIGTGHLQIHTTDFRLKNSAGTESMILANADGNVQLYYDNAEKLATTATGIDVTGSVERLRVTSAGNVGIGTSSPNAVADLHVADTSDARIWLDATSADTMELYSGTGVGMFNRSNSYLMLGTNNTERLRIDASGNVGLGVTPSAWAASSNALQVGSYAGLSRNDALGAGDLSYNAYMTTAASDSWSRMLTNASTRIHQRDGSIQFKYAASGTAGTAITWSESMRINIAGNLLLGKGTASIDELGVIIKPTGDTYVTVTAGINTYHVYDTTNNLYTFYVGSNGGISNFSANNVNLSDEREKKNVEALPSQWDCLKHWDLKQFHYNADDDALPKKYGVIAQEIEAHCPEVIDVFKVDEDTERKGVKEQQMMWMAIKALQEAQTRIESLEARIAALES